jgi:hypothetical protein
MPPTDAATGTNGTGTNENNPAPALLSGGKGSEELNKLHINIPRPLAVAKEFNFAFRKHKDDVTGEIVKKPSIKLALPVPTSDGLVEALADEKVMSFVLDVLADELKAAARVQVDDATKPVTEQSELDLTKINLLFLANQPKSERGGPKIPEEQWESFGRDYMAIMPEATGRPVESVQIGLNLFLKKLAPVKNQKDVLRKLQSLLNTYITTTENGEEFTDVLEYLTGRLETLLSAEEVNLLESL